VIAFAACALVAAAAAQDGAGQADPPGEKAPIVAATTPVPAAGVPGLVAADATVEVLVDGLRFAEGPAADARGNITFCDLATSEVFRLEREGATWKKTRIAAGTKGVSGLAWSADGALVGCQMRAGTVVTLVPGEGGAVTLAPRALSGDAARAGLNDLTFDRDGRLWVTNMGDRKHPEWAGVWCIPPAGDAVHAPVGATRPNGIRWSPEGGGSGTLWVADYARPRAFRVPAVPGALGAGTEVSLAFAAAPKGSGGADGLAIDAQGNAWIALPGHDRIAVVAADGSPRGFLDVPDGPSNCAFGGADGKTLFVTTRSTVRAVQTLVVGVWVARGTSK
jgi:gluconolactonase